MPDTTPGAAPAAPAVDAGPPKIPNARQDVQARIDELAAQKAHFQEQAKKQKAELQQLREEMAFLKGQQEQGQRAPETPRKSPARSWQEMSEDELENAKKYARENEQPALIDAAYREEARREAEKARAAAVEEATKRFQREQLLRDVHTRILEDFGREAFDRDGPLYQAADRYLAEVRRVEGDTSAGQPYRLYDAFAHAERATRTLGEREKLKALEQENQRLKEAASLAERGGAALSNARQMPDEAKEALKSGDRKAAIRRLGLTKNLAQSVKQDLLPPRR